VVWPDAVQSDGLLCSGLASRRPASLKSAKTPQTHLLKSTAPVSGVCGLRWRKEQVQAAA